MKHFNYHAINESEVSDFGSTNTSIRVFISEEEAPNFIMRRFEIGPGGNIGVHAHPWEHEIYMLAGELVLTNDKGTEEKVEKDEFIFIPANEPHGYLNESDKIASFICLVPKKK